MLVRQIGLQAFHRQAAELHPDGFLNELRLDTLFQNRIDLFLRQRFAQQTLEPLGSFRNRRALGKGILELLDQLFEIER